MTSDGLSLIHLCSTNCSPDPEESLKWEAWRPQFAQNLHSIPFTISNFDGSLRNSISIRHSSSFCILQHESSKSFGLTYINRSKGRNQRCVLKPICATGSGLETSMTDLKGSTLKLKKAEIVVESRDADKMQLRVDLGGEDTQKAFDVVLGNLAQAAPLLPGFRRSKGGKTSKIPKKLLTDIIGKDTVMKFVLREIVTSTVANFVKEKNLTVKEDKINTTQTEDELNQSFLPGNEFGFNVELELVNEEAETSEEIDTEIEIVSDEAETNEEIKAVDV